MRILTKRRSGSNSSFIIFPLLITPNEPVYVVVVSAGLLFFASSWDFGFFVVGQSKSRARAFAHSLAGVQRVCMPRSIYMCSCDCVCLTALCCGVPGCYRRLRAYYSSAMHVWMCMCVFAIPSNFPYALQFLCVQSNASAQSAHTTYVSSSGCFVCVLCCSVCVCMLCALVRLGSLKMSNRQYEICLLPASAISHRCVSL